MKALNRAIGDADAFTKMLAELQRTEPAPKEPVSAEVAEWNAAVEARKAERRARKLAVKVKP